MYMQNIAEQTNVYIEKRLINLNKWKMINSQKVHSSANQIFSREFCSHSQSISFLSGKNKI
jgi:hypothetical protein